MVFDTQMVWNYHFRLPTNVGSRSSEGARRMGALLWADFVREIRLLFDKGADFTGSTNMLHFDSCAFAGCFISVEQPGASVMFELECFQRLLSPGCWVTKFAFCNYGSGFNKPSKWLHNKPWLSQLGGFLPMQFSWSSLRD